MVTVEHSWHRLLLRARPERPRCSRAAELREELAPLHSIISSASAINVDGTVRPSIVIGSLRSFEHRLIEGVHVSGRFTPNSVQTLASIRCPQRRSDALKRLTPV
jgi:hypothetical protein